MGKSAEIASLFLKIIYSKIKPVARMGEPEPPLIFRGKAVKRKPAWAAGRDGLGVQKWWCLFLIKASRDSASMDGHSSFAWQGASQCAQKCSGRENHPMLARSLFLAEENRFNLNGGVYSGWGAPFPSFMTGQWFLPASFYFCFLFI